MSLTVTPETKTRIVKDGETGERIVYDNFAALSVTIDTGHTAVRVTERIERHRIGALISQLRGVSEALSAEAMRQERAEVPAAEPADPTDGTGVTEAKAAR